MKKLSLRMIMFFFFLLLCQSLALAQQTDSSSFFPLGLWGVWVDNGAAPFYNRPVGNMWSHEKANWQNIKANYLVFGMPRSVEDTVVMYADTINYRVAVANNDYVTADTNALITWLRFGTFADSARPIRIIQKLKAKYQTHAAFHSYWLDDEGSLDNSSRWPFIELVARNIHQLDPTRKSCASTGPVPSQAFFDSIPSLDIFQYDQYPFFSMYDQKYSHQQAALDNHLIGPYSDLMNRLRGKRTEWQVIIQGQQDIRSNPEATILRRPNFYELRIQAYLALSRGARGILTYVYGSDMPPVAEPVLPAAPSSAASKIIGEKGLVVYDGSAGYRRPWEALNRGSIHPFENVAKLNLELVSIGPTIRKLCVYDAFPHTSIPSNVAHISSLSSDYNGKPRLEIGTFKRIDEGTDSTVYFMVVNRVCNNEDGSDSHDQTVRVGFTYGSNLEVTEVVSGKIWIVAPNENFGDQLPPGGGKLYMLRPAP
jgi:hypothetical protein